ncbi:hypothetical protein SFUMM280S_07234 [Streptomyces fumanus]
MTLRVYTVDREGRVTSDSGIHGFEGAEADTATSRVEVPVRALRVAGGRARQEGLF